MYIVGKWYIGLGIVGSMMGSGQMFDQWGFECSYVLFGGVVMNYFVYELVGLLNYMEDGCYVQLGQFGQLGGVGGSLVVFYLIDFYMQKLILYIDVNKQDGKLFFVYVVYMLLYWLLQVFDLWLYKYVGVYDVGYDVICNVWIVWQKVFGLILVDFKLFDGLFEMMVVLFVIVNNGMVGVKYINVVYLVVDGYGDYGFGKVDKLWLSLLLVECKVQVCYMEIYVGMVENFDYNIGLLIQYLKDIGEYDNMFIMFQLDNGVEGWLIDFGVDLIVIDIVNVQELIYLMLGIDNGKQNVQCLQYGLCWVEVSVVLFWFMKGYLGEGGVLMLMIVYLLGQLQLLLMLCVFMYVIDNMVMFFVVVGVMLLLQLVLLFVNMLMGVDQNKGKVVYNNCYVYLVMGQLLLLVFIGLVMGEVYMMLFGDEVYGCVYLCSVDGCWKVLWIELLFGLFDGYWQLYDFVLDCGEMIDVFVQNLLVIGMFVDQWKVYMSNVGGVELLCLCGYY